MFSDKLLAVKWEDRRLILTSPSVWPSSTSRGDAGGNRTNSTRSSDCHALGNLIDQHEAQDETLRCVKLKANAAQRTVHGWAHVRVLRAILSERIHGQTLPKERKRVKKTDATSPKWYTNETNPITNGK